MNRFTHAFALAFATMLLGLTASVARADFQVTLSDVKLPPGGTGRMDFLFKSDNNDTLSQFGLGLMIKPVGTPATLLEFSANQPVPYNNPTYVFSGHSFNSDNALPFWSHPYLTNYASDTIIGGDSNNSSQGYVSIQNTFQGPHSYLASVEFDVPSGAAIGEQFRISVFTDPFFTYFDDRNGNPVAYSIVGTGGVVTVAVVPEPASFTLMVLSGFGVVFFYGLGRRKALSRSLLSAASPAS